MMALGLAVIIWFAGIAGFAAMVAGWLLRLHLPHGRAILRMGGGLMVLIHAVLLLVPMTPVLNSAGVRDTPEWLLALALLWPLLAAAAVAAGWGRRP